MASMTPRKDMKVVVYQYGYMTKGLNWFKTSTITKVNKETFRVEGDDRLFDIRDWTHRLGSYGPTTRVVLSASPEARQIRAEAQVVKARRGVDRAYEAYAKSNQVSDLNELINWAQKLRELTSGS